MVVIRLIFVSAPGPYQSFFDRAAPGWPLQNPFEPIHQPLPPPPQIHWPQSANNPSSNLIRFWLVKTQNCSAPPLSAGFRLLIENSMCSTSSDKSADARRRASPAMMGQAQKRLFRLPANPPFLLGWGVETASIHHHEM